MFAAASGARLARKKDGVKKQHSAGHIEGLNAHYGAYHHHPFLKYPDGPNIPARYGQRRIHYYTSSEYVTDLNLSPNYVDFNGKMSGLGLVDFEGKAAWQDREQGTDYDRRGSLDNSEAASSHRAKQKEAHRRWVKRNRVHDSSLGDCSSDDDELYGGRYGVQSAAANALLYIGLGTMCVGMIIAFVGTGEKGFKTMELRLIGPTLIGTGVMIIILRIMLCVCPSNCIRKHKHKHKNSTNKLNSEGAMEGEDIAMADRTSLLKAGPGDDSKKRVSIVTMPTDRHQYTSTTASFLEMEQQKSSKLIPTISLPQTREEDEEEIELQNMELSSFELSAGSGGEERARRAVSREDSDISITSLTNGLICVQSADSAHRRTVKFENTRSPKNEIVLSPSKLTEVCETD